MFPGLGGWRLYPLFFFLAVALGVVVPLVLARREGALTPRFAAAVILVASATLLGAKLFALIERSGNVGTLWGEVIGGYRAPGAIIGSVVGLTLLPTIGVPAWRTADLLAPGAALGMAAFRVGCFLTGCCAGVRCDLPWAVSFPAGSVVWKRHLGAGLIAADAPWSLSVHPLQLYMALWSLVLSLVAYRIHQSSEREGQAFLVYLALASIGKFALESLRYGYLAHLQYAALVSAFLAGAAYWQRKGLAA